MVYEKRNEEFEEDLPSILLDTQLLHIFKKWQQEFEDLDMNFEKCSLLSKAIKALHLYLVRFLIMDSEEEILQMDVELWDWLCRLDIKE